MNFRTILGKIKRAFIFAVDYQADRECQKLANYNIGGKYKRIYLYHIRKTGGTSLNNMFLSLGGDDGADLYKKINSSLSQRTFSNTMVFQGWNPLLIERGNFYYGFSHLPSHHLNLRSDTFTITCLRDPYKRIISLYKMLIDQVENDSSHPGLKSQRDWLGNSFSDFINRIPKQELLNQIYMFSEKYDVDEAVKKIKSLNHYFFTEDFNTGISELSSKLNINLVPIHIRTLKNKFEILNEDKERLYELLSPEYELISKLTHII